MAEKRMFTQRIVESDAFTSLSVAAQALYFHMGMVADDDGFLNRTKSLMTNIGVDQRTLDELTEKNFIIAFDGGIYCIRHWRMNNTTRKDRYNPTQYQEEMAQLEEKSNGAYTMGTVFQNPGNHSGNHNGDAFSKTCSRNGGRVFENAGQMVASEENSIVESNIEEKREKEYRGEGRETNSSAVAVQSHVRSSATNPSDPPLLGKYENISLSPQELAKLKLTHPKAWRKKIDALSEYLYYGGKDDGRHFELIETFDFD